MIEFIHAQENNGSRIGISAAHEGAESVGTAHQECREALHITRRLHDPRSTVHFDDLGYLHALYRAGKASLVTNPYVPKLRLLLNEQQADLFNTLETYLDAGGNGVQTSEVLHVHRSTLNYRLERIEKVAAVTLSDPATRTNLQVALKLMRLFEVE
jgi:purine catabolism regulator